MDLLEPMSKTPLPVNPYPRIAVLLAAYNGAEFIDEQISSITAQRQADVQLFVSVDASSDGTEACVSAWLADNPQITLLPTGQRFGGAAPNFFRLINDVDLSTFDYVSFSDQDDRWYPSKLWRAYQILKTQEAAGYSSNVLAFWPDGTRCEINKAQPQTPWDFLFEAAGPGCTYVLRQDLALSLQTWVRANRQALQNVYLHDWLIYAFARANGHRWVIDDDINMGYRQHSANQVGVNAGWRAFKYRAGKVLSGWAFNQSLIIVNLLKLDTLPFVRRWKSGGRLGMLWLAFHARQCRRRPRDQVLFALSCLIAAVLGRR